MAQPVTLLELREEVREQTDSVADEHIPDAAINRWINKGLRVMYGKLIAADDDFYVVTATFTSTAGTLEYALPDDFRALRLLALNDGARRHRLLPFRFEEIYDRSSMTGSGNRPRYLVARNGVDGTAARLLFDVDPGQSAFTHHYVPVPPILVADDDEVDGVLGFDDYSIAYACARVRKKRDEPADEERFEMARVEAEIASLAKQRHLDGQERPARVRRRFRSYRNEEDIP